MLKGVSVVLISHAALGVPRDQKLVFLNVGPYANLVGTEIYQDSSRCEILSNFGKSARSCKAQ